MYAVVVRERGQADQINTSGEHVQAKVLPRARQALGIVSGFLDDGHGRRDVECHGLRKRGCREIGFGAGTHRTQTARDASGKCRRL